MSDETASRDLSPTRETIIQALSTIRQRTLDIVTPISESGLGEQHSPLMSPIVWDLGHIAEFEDLWLVERLGESQTHCAHEAISLLSKSDVLRATFGYAVYPLPQ